jgi:hypothetical protein
LEKAEGKVRPALALGFQPSCKTFHRFLRSPDGSDYRFANPIYEYADQVVITGDAWIRENLFTGSLKPAKKTEGSEIHAST